MFEVIHQELGGLFGTKFLVKAEESIEESKSNDHDSIGFLLENIGKSSSDKEKIIEGRVELANKNMEKRHVFKRD